MTHKRPGRTAKRIRKERLAARLAKANPQKTEGKES